MKSSCRENLRQVGRKQTNGKAHIMNPASNDETHESRQSLWLLIVSPSMWAAHFLPCYITAAVWCEKFAGRMARSAARA